jgi:hypothetical protein
MHGGRGEIHFPKKLATTGLKEIEGDKDERVDKGIL